MLKKFLSDNSIQNNSARAVYEYIYFYGPITQARLCEMTKLKRLKVTRIIEELLENEYIQKAGYEKPSGGRPPLAYQINSKASYIVSIHITRTSTRITLFDLRLQALGEKYFHMTKMHTPIFVLKEIVASIHSFMEIYQFTVNELLGIGIAAVGPFDRDKGMILKPEQFLANGWEDVPIIKMVKEHFPVKILLENAPSVIALGEYQYLKNSHKNILFCLNGWVLACGIITDGNMVRLKSGDVSGYGHMIINTEDKEYSCGSKGYAVNYLSLRTILDQIRDTHPAIYKQLRDDEGYLSIGEMMNIVSSKEELNAIVDNSAYYYGISVASLSNIFQSSAVVLGGPLVQLIPGYYEKAVLTAEQYIRDKNVIFRREEEKTAVEGAAMVVLNSYI